MLISPRRVCPSESKAPALIRDSTTRLLQAEASTLAKKSWKSAKRPFAVRDSMIESTTASPTLRTADNPNRMVSSTAVKRDWESLTSGGKTLTPMCRHSAR